MENLADAILWFPVFLFSTTLHEAAHATAGLLGGDDTAYLGGQVSLNPGPHIKREPIGMVVVPFLSMFLGGYMIGWASTPYNPQWAERYPRRSALMSLAGPAANLLLLLIAGLAIHIGITTGLFIHLDAIGFGNLVGAQNESFAVLARLISITFSLNLLLFLFNLLPIPPMDGSELPGLFASHQQMAKIRGVLNQPTVQMVGLFFAWSIFGRIFSPAHLWAINLLFPGYHYG